MEARARQFAGDVSHELRTPLTAMTAVTDILHEHPGLTGDAAAAAELVRQEVFHLNRLVDDLIEISASTRAPPSSSPTRQTSAP
jgi:two-component system, OmpR family, sensor histidine kinase MtrB